MFTCNSLLFTDIQKKIQFCTIKNALHFLCLYRHRTWQSSNKTVIANIVRIARTPKKINGESKQIFVEKCLTLLSLLCEGAPSTAVSVCTIVFLNHMPMLLFFFYVCSFAISQFNVRLLYSPIRLFDSLTIISRISEFCILFDRKYHDHGNVIKVS